MHSLYQYHRNLQKFSFSPKLVVCIGSKWSKLVPNVCKTSAVWLCFPGGIHYWFQQFSFGAFKMYSVLILFFL